jgi:hypothetical protein
MTEPPTGWLWGVPPGQKYKNEGWEGLAFWGIGGSLVLTAIAYAYKPDTRYVCYRFGSFGAAIGKRRE